MTETAAPERETRIKKLPLTELSITAVASITDIYEDEETGKQLPVIEMEVLNEEDWNKFNAPKSEAHHCAICGHSLKISCAVTHKPTGNGYWIGRDCARKITELQKFGDIIKGATVALAQRLACDKREADFMAEHPDAIGIITWSKRPAAPRICRDICEKLRRFGSISEKQIALLEKIRQQYIDRRAKATGTATNGRQLVTGRVVKVVVEDKTVGRWGKTMIANVILDLGNGVRLMGNLPEYTEVNELIMSRVPQYLQTLGYEVSNHEIVKVGDTVQFTATVQQSQRDDLFGFWKRPVKFQYITLAPPPPPPVSVPVPEDEKAIFRDAVVRDNTGFIGVLNICATEEIKRITVRQFGLKQGWSTERVARFVIAVMNKSL